MLRFVFNTPGAIGYVRADEVDDSVKVLAIDDLLPGDAQYPLRRGVRAGKVSGRRGETHGDGAAADALRHDRGARDRDRHGARARLDRRDAICASPPTTPTSCTSSFAKRLTN